MFATLYMQRLDCVLKTNSWKLCGYFVSFFCLPAGDFVILSYQYIPTFQLIFFFLIRNKHRSKLFLNSLLSLSIRGQTKWTPKYRKVTKLITWTTALSNSMKLWAMPCRATQDRRSWWRDLTKRGPLEKGMTNHFSILALKTPWTVWKAKKIGQWKMNFQGQ